MNFEKEVKKDLDLEYIKVFSWKFPSFLNWIGGMINPIFSFFVIKNKRWKSLFGESHDKEVIAHEMMHLYLLNKGWRALIIVSVLYLSIIHVTASSLFEFGKIYDYLWVLLINFSAMSGLFTYFEYDTIESTRKYAKFKGFNVRPKRETKRMYKAYFVIYWAQFALFYSIIKIIEFIIQKLI